MCKPPRGQISSSAILSAGQAQVHLSKKKASFFCLSLVPDKKEVVERCGFQCVLVVSGLSLQVLVGFALSGFFFFFWRASPTDLQQLYAHYQKTEASTFYRHLHQLSQLWKVESLPKSLIPYHLSCFCFPNWILSNALPSAAMTLSDYNKDVFSITLGEKNPQTYKFTVLPASKWFFPLISIFSHEITLKNLKLWNLTFW